MVRNHFEPVGLLLAAHQYFDWVAKNYDIGTRQEGDYVTGQKYVIRPKMTVESLCSFINISQESWNSYKKDCSYNLTIALIEDCIEKQIVEY